MIMVTIIHTMMLIIITIIILIMKIITTKNHTGDTNKCNYKVTHNKNESCIIINNDYVDSN